MCICHNNMLMNFPFWLSFSYLSSFFTVANILRNILSKIANFIKFWNSQYQFLWLVLCHHIPCSVVSLSVQMLQLKIRGCWTRFLVQNTTDQRSTQVIHEQTTESHNQLPIPKTQRKVCVKVVKHTAYHMINLMLCSDLIIMTLNTPL